MQNIGTKKNMIIAIPNARFAEGIKRFIDRQGAYKVVETVVVLEHLVEQLEMFKDEGKDIDAIFLSTDIARKLNDQRLEYLSDTLLTIRERYSHVSFAVLSNQRTGHPFLAELINMGIYNIFTKKDREDGDNQLDLPHILKTLDQPLLFSDVAAFRNIDSSIPWRKLYKGGETIRIEVDRKEAGQEISEKNKDVEKVEEVVTPTKKAPPQSKDIKWRESKEQTYISFPPKTITVLSLYPQTGSTFLIDNLSYFLSEKNIPVGVLEGPTTFSMFYEFLGGDRTKPSEWSPWIQQIKEHGFVDKPSEWISNNIRYYPFGKESIGDCTKEHAMKLLYLTKLNPILFIDLSHILDNPVAEVAIQQADEVWILISGDPIQLNMRFKYLRPLIHRLGAEKKSILIGNKWNKTYSDILTTDVIEERTGLSLVTTIPDLSDLYIRSVIEGKKMIEFSKARETLIKPFLPFV